MKSFKLFHEKKKWIDHEIDPKPYKIWQMLKKSKEKAIRLVYNTKTDVLYVFDAYESEHDSFIKMIKCKDKCSLGLLSLKTDKEGSETMIDIPEQMEKNKIISEFLEKYRDKFFK